MGAGFESPKLAKMAGIYKFKLLFNDINLSTSGSHVSFCGRDIPDFIPELCGRIVISSEDFLIKDCIKVQKELILPNTAIIVNQLPEVEFLHGEDFFDALRKRRWRQYIKVETNLKSISICLPKLKMH